MLLHRPAARPPAKLLPAFISLTPFSADAGSGPARRAPRDRGEAGPSRRLPRDGSRQEGRRGTGSGGRPRRGPGRFGKRRTAAANGGGPGVAGTGARTAKRAASGAPGSTSRRVPQPPSKAGPDAAEPAVAQQQASPGSCTPQPQEGFVQAAGRLARPLPSPAEAGRTVAARTTTAARPRTERSRVLIALDEGVRPRPKVGREKRAGEASFDGVEKG